MSYENLSDLRLRAERERLVDNLSARLETYADPKSPARAAKIAARAVENLHDWLDDVHAEMDRRGLDHPEVYSVDDMKNRARQQYA